MRITTGGAKPTDRSPAQRRGSGNVVGALPVRRSIVRSSQKKIVGYKISYDSGKSIEEIARDAGAVQAVSEEDLRIQLERAHPAPQEGVSYVYGPDQFGPLQDVEIGNSYPHDWGDRSFYGFMITDRPVCSLKNLNAIRDVTRRAGPVLVPESNLHEILQLSPPENWIPSDDRQVTWRTLLADQGFTCQERRFDLVQVNHNPKAVQRRPYLQAKREAQERLRGQFPWQILNAFVAALRPDNWPETHPWRQESSGPYFGAWRYDRSLKGPKIVESYGTRYYRYTVAEVLWLIDFNRKLHPRPWWRNVSQSRIRGMDNGALHYTTLEEAIKAALQYVHEVERKNREGLDRAIREEETRRAIALAQASVGLPDGRKDGRPVQYRSLEAHGIIEDDQKDPDYREVRGGMQYQLRFCRWLRREARALGIRMPPKPKMPDPPSKKGGTKRRRKTRWKKTRNTRRSSSGRKTARGSA